MPLTLTLRAPSPIPIEVDGLTPDRLQGRSARELERLDVQLGNRAVPLAELFAVEGNADDGRIVFQGDLAGVHGIGANMATGEIRVAGAAGRHVGREMAGGEITVEGDAGDRLGGEMRGGLIRVHGRAADGVGAAYPGSRRGMTGGAILVDGGAGNEVGRTMRRGLIAIGGECGDLVGFNMLAGSILIFSHCGVRPGAGMKRGTIGLLGSTPPALLPTFRHACKIQPHAALLLANVLKRHRFPSLESLLDTFNLYRGDFLAGGRGELWIR